MKGQFYCIVYRPVGSVANLQRVQERVSDGFEVKHHKALKCLNHHRGQGDGSVIIESSDLCFFGDGDDGRGLEEDTITA